MYSKIHSLTHLNIPHHTILQARRKDVIGVRVGPSCAGLLLQCRDMAQVARTFKELADHGPADFLLSWLLSYQPWPGEDA